MKNKKNNYKYFFLALLISFIFITLGSKNSFLYRINDWYDAQAFMTMGKGLIHGLIPYKDLFEQKGPILYFIFALANLISETSFLGVYLIEIIAFTFFLYYVRKIINLFYDDKYTTASFIILAFAIMMLKPFGHGASAEELCLPFFMYSIYSLFKFLQTGSTSKKEIFINGLIAGIILWLKYTLLGFHFILAATYFFVNIFNKKYKEAFLSSFIFLSGMFGITVIVLAFFGYHDALKELFEVYFLTNMTSYSKISSPLEKIGTAIYLLGYNIVTNIPFLIFILIPLVIYLFKKINLKVKGAKGIIFISLLFMGLGTFIGGTNYFYYSFIITPFMILGVLLLNELANKFNIIHNGIRDTSLLLLIIIIMLLINPNIQYIKLKKEDYAQFVFADIIKRSTDRSIINYGFLDGGFYYTTETLPECYYFMRNNFSYENYPIMYEEQKNYIINKKPHYVVTRNKKEFLEDLNYGIIKSMKQKYEDKYVTYYLYER